MITVLKLSEVPIDNLKLRLDSQYFDPVAISAIAQVRSKPNLQAKTLCKKILKGKTVPYVEDGDVPIVRSGNVGQFMSASSLLMARETEEIFYLKKGDVLISSIGLGSIGKVQLFNTDGKFGTVSEVTVVRQSQVDPAFLAAFLGSEYGQIQINRQITGATGQLHLYPDDVGQIYMPKPSADLEKKIKDFFIEADDSLVRSNRATAEAEAAMLDALGLLGWRPPAPLTYSARATDAFAAERLDAQFYAPRVRALLDLLYRDGSTLSDVSKPRRNRFNASKCDHFHYIEIGDMEGGGGVGSTLLDSADAPSRATWHVRPGDVLTSTVRPIRRLSAIVAPEQDGYVASSGFAVLQPIGVTPEVLMTFLRLPAICELMDLYASASMYPAISEADILGLPIPNIPDDLSKTVTQSVQSAFAARARSRALLTAAKRAVEIAIEEGEVSALAYLAQKEANANG